MIAKRRKDTLPDDGEYGTLYDALGLTLELLGEEKRCAMLAVFPEDTEVPFAVVGQLWQTNDEIETAELVMKLALWEVVEVDSKNTTLSLIDLHLDCLRAIAKDDLAGWHGALLRTCEESKRLTSTHVNASTFASSAQNQKATWTRSEGLLDPRAPAAPPARLRGHRERARPRPKADGPRPEWHEMEGLTSLPSLDGLTALQTLDLKRCSGLTSLPSLDGLTALQTLNLNGCCVVGADVARGLSLLGLTALHQACSTGCASWLASKVSLDGAARRCRRSAFGSSVSLDGLTALQTLDLCYCSDLTSLPSLDGLTALQELNLWGC